MMQLEQEHRKFERRLEKDRREFEQSLEKERKEFDLKLFNISRKIQSERDEASQKSEKFNRRITWFFIILVILGLLPLAFPDGIPALVKVIGG